MVRGKSLPDGIRFENSRVPRDSTLVRILDVLFSRSRSRKLERASVSPYDFYRRREVADGKARRRVRQGVPYQFRSLYVPELAKHLTDESSEAAGEIGTRRFPVGLVRATERERGGRGALSKTHPYTVSIFPADGLGSIGYPMVHWSAEVSRPPASPCPRLLV